MLSSNLLLVSSYDNTRFRITAWPPSPLPHPGNFGGITYVYDQSADALVPDWDATKNGLVAKPLATTETYIKLAALDPNDITAITDFANHYGQLDLRGEGIAAQGGDAFGFRGEGHPDLEAAYERAANAVGEGGFTDTLTEIRWAILYMRDLISARRAVSGEINAAEHQWEAPFWKGMHELDSPPWTANGPAATLSLALHVGLAPFQPRIDLVPEGTDQHQVFAGDDFGTWSLCCLELFNHILEDAIYKTCANETCGRLFVRQEGRAELGQYKSKGVKYCTSECANAQAQRAYRRRNRPS
jgi:hypothetical protein